jgi:hypothetical protein
MAGERAKLRVVMGVFEDLACLGSAADALMNLGLDPTDLCFAAGRETAPADTADIWIPTEQSSPMTWFQHGGPTPAASAGSGFASKAASLIAATLAATVVAPGFYRSPVADVWNTMNTHLADGALLLFARLPSAALQDQAVRALLRYSRHPVHAEEFFSPAELS